MVRVAPAAAGGGENASGGTVTATAR
jgi:hypothetical protein